MNTKTNFLQSYFRTMTFTKRAIVTILTIVTAVVLPQAVHYVGMVLGVGSQIGEILLPMHFPILLVGLLAGPYAGLVAGALAPIISFALTGMPGVHMLPFITVELMVYGFSIGCFQKTRIPTIGKVGLAQLAGRMVRAVFIGTSIYVFGNTAISISIVVTSIMAGLFGIVLQLILIPVIMHYVEGNE